MEENKDTLASEILHHLIVQNKRIFAVLIVTLIMLFASNLAWMYVFNQYDFQSYEYTQDGNGENTLNSNIGGDVYNGAEIKSKDEDKKEPSDGKGNGYAKAEEEVNGNQ